MTNNETFNKQDSQNPDAGGFVGVMREGGGNWGFPQNPGRVKRVAAAAEFLSEALSGRMPIWALKEAIVPTSPQGVQAVRSNYPELFREGYSTSDFPNLMGDVLDRMMLANFSAQSHNWQAYCSRRPRPLRDFRTVRALAFNGGEGQYSKVVEGEGLEYSQTLAEDDYTYAPDLYALGITLSFRAIMNDDLSAFDSIPSRLGKGGRRTIEKFVTELFFDANGPDATFFSSGNGNLLTGNPDLAIDSLGDAFEKLLGFTDADSEPIMVEGATLVYGPGLEVTVNNLMNMLTADVTVKGGASDQTMRINNWIVRGLTPVMNPYIPIVASTANGATSWALFANPNSGRPAGEIGFLNGFEQPRLYQKASNSQAISGGLDQAAGDFATMETHYKGVVGFGGTTLEVKSAVASKGSNS